MSKRPTGGGGDCFSIKSSLVGVLALLAALFLFPAAMGVFSSYQDWTESRRMEAILNQGIDLFQAVRNFGYERGRINVVLNHAGPLEEMAANREFIKSRRQEGEQALSRALSGISGGQADSRGSALAKLKQSRARVLALRAQADEQMLLPKQARDPGLPQAWFSAMNSMVLSIRELLDALCVDMSTFDGRSMAISQLMLTTSAMRDEAAPEMALLSGVMLSGEAITNEIHDKILQKRGKTEQLWNAIRVTSASLGSARVQELAATFRTLYLDRYLPLGQEILQAALTAGPYRVSQKEFLSTGVEAMEGLLSLMAGVVEAGNQRAREVHDQAMAGLLANIGMLLAGAALIVAASFVVISRVINPLAQLVASIKSIAHRQLELEVPFKERKDEIGSLARAVDTLKDNTEKMIADYTALEESKAKLEQAMAEVRVLSGLLPICSHCKKIRDDQGYWKRLEEYVEKHSQAQFSHGICPDCAQILYPGYVK